MGVLIDTGVFISWERDSGKVDFSRWSSLGEPAISVITQSELMVGVYRAKLTLQRDRRLRFVETVISNVSVGAQTVPVIGASNSTS
jgi:tRNA(fMet)-specific endonuclease VapC